ncbi:hypothetical protein [Leptolyngbya sp. FACHB-711]|nr:hypothetical protein [Leptolyngbya sp. FACHB-711]
MEIRIVKEAIELINVNHDFIRIALRNGMIGHRLPLQVHRNVV